VTEHYLKEPGFLSTEATRQKQKKPAKFLLIFTSTKEGNTQAIMQE